MDVRGVTARITMLTAGGTTNRDVRSGTSSFGHVTAGALDLVNANADSAGDLAAHECVWLTKSGRNGGSCLDLRATGLGLQPASAGSIRFGGFRAQDLDSLGLIDRCARWRGTGPIGARRQRDSPVLITGLRGSGVRYGIISHGRAEYADHRC